MFMIVSLLNLCADSFFNKATTFYVSCLSVRLTSMLTLQLQRLKQPEAKDNCREQTLFCSLHSLLWNIGGREEQMASKQTAEQPEREHVRDMITVLIFELF